MPFELCATTISQKDFVELTLSHHSKNYWAVGLKPYYETFCQNLRAAPLWAMFRTRLLSGGFIALWLFSTSAAELFISDDAPLQMPSPGAHQLRVLSPTLLEL